MPLPLKINENCTLYRGDCLEVMPQLAIEGIRADMVLTDPPYGTTRCGWDSVIDFGRMWEALGRITAENTPVLLFSQQPFTCMLGSSNIRRLRYNWVWEKTQGTGFLNAKRMPLKCHEDILVFYGKLPKYRPVKTDGHIRKVATAGHKRNCRQGDTYGDHGRFTDYDSTERYPRSVLRYKTDKQTCALHSAQKPVALLEYLIRTYTDEGDTVVDFAMGSGSTGIACLNTGRRFIGIEIDPEIFGAAKTRLSTLLTDRNRLSHSDKKKL